MRARGDGNADADGDERALGVRLGGGVRHARALVDEGRGAIDVAGDARDGVARAVLEEDDEFVAAEAADEVAVAHDGVQALGEGNQDLVAEVVTAKVVRGLEVVEIHHEEGMAVAGCGRFEQIVFDELTRGGLVVETCQRIGLGLVFVGFERGVLGSGDAAACGSHF